MSGNDLKIFYKKCFKILEMFDLLHRNDTIDNFSLGMKEKLDFSLMISRPGKVILLDEPFGALDTPSLKLAQKVLAENSRGKIGIIEAYS